MIISIWFNYLIILVPQFCYNLFTEQILILTKILFLKQTVGISEIQINIFYSMLLHYTVDTLKNNLNNVSIRTIN